MQNKKTFALAAWVLLGLFLVMPVEDFLSSVILLGNSPSLESKRFLAFLVFLVLLVAAWVYGLWLIWDGTKPRWLESLQIICEHVSFSLRALLALFFILLPAILFIYTPIGLYGMGFWLQATIVLVFAFLVVVVMFPRPEMPEWLLFYATAVALGGAFVTVAGWLSRVTSYPFPLSWSEGNRLWDYSIVFASDRYLRPTITPIFTFISSGRQLMWALFFLIPNINIWGVRLLDALTWIIFPLGLGWVAVFRRNVGQPDWAWKAGFILWAFLLVSQGPIYAPLLVCAILVVVGVRLRNLALSCLLIILAAYYANLSRWTWTYAPGLWAGMLALLDEHSPGFKRGQLKTLVRPLLLGAAGYLGGQVLPQVMNMLQRTAAQAQQISLVIDPSRGVSRQPLLWDRLFPNTTYSPGILLGAAWAALPIVLLLAWLIIRRVWKINLLQVLGVALPNLAFLGVGLVASTKIGGGSNLHNLDMFWVGMVMAAAWAWKEMVPKYARLGGLQFPAVVLISVALVAPALYLIQYGSPLVLPNKQEVQEAMQTLKAQVAQAQQQGEVLFLDQRQTLTFGDVQGVPLVVEYEKKYLMDQAMEGNPVYFKKFYQDLAAHRFVLIVSEPLAYKFQGKGTVFGDENDAYVKWVTGPLLCYYEPTITFANEQLQFLVPRPIPLVDAKMCPQP